MLTASTSQDAGPGAEASPAQIFFSQAEQAFAERQFEKALKLYLSSYEASQLPELLFNVGQCYRNLSRPQDALFYYQRYLSLKPDAANRDAVLALIDEMKLLVGMSQVQTIQPFYKSGMFWAMAVVGVGAIGALTFLAVRKPVTE